MKLSDLLIPQDKATHIIGSAVLFDLTLPMAGPMGAFLFTTGIGIGKELVWDLYLKKGTPDYKDFLADMIGIGLAFAPYYYGAKYGFQ